MRAEEPSGQPTGSFEGTFLKDLASQLRANDLYGTLDAKSDEELLGGLIKPKKGDGSSCSPLDSATLEKIRAFYRSIAVTLERDTGGFFQMVLEVSSEGFGRVVIYAGRLVVLDKTLRDAQAFGFSSLEKLLCDARNATCKAKALFERFKEVASTQ
jgi:probable nitrogen fixation protein